jgi:hypothetical protein
MKTRTGRRTAAEMAVIRKQLAEHIMSGQNMKSFACGVGYSLNWAYYMARELGFSAVWLSPEEQRMIAAQRRAAKEAAA